MANLVCFDLSNKKRNNVQRQIKVIKPSLNGVHRDENVGNVKSEPRVPKARAKKLWFSDEKEGVGAPLFRQTPQKALFISSENSDSNCDNVLMNSVAKQPSHIILCILGKHV